MWSPFRKNHLKKLLETSLSTTKPLDLHAHNYFKINRSLGSKDRPIIKKGLYEIIKWKKLLNWHKALTPSELVNLYTDEKCPIGKNHPSLPPHIQISFPQWLFQEICLSMPFKEAMNFCKISNEQAPVTIRINQHKCDKDLFYKKYKDNLGLSALNFAKSGFNLHKKVQFNSFAPFLNGHFEPQDEASQIICEIVNAKPGQQILDYCAGSGGKTLGFAAQMNNQGQIHLHDVRKKPLLDAKKRLKKANVQHFQLYLKEETRMKSLLGKMDTVLVDAPCSCTGTFRRRPDHKWMLTKESLKDLVLLQQEILLKSIKYLKKNGTLIYATCSALKQENQDQSDFIQEKGNLTLISSKSIPLHSDGNDAMYVASFQKNPLV